MKACSKCGEEKPLDSYDKDSRKPGRHIAQCKTCRRAQQQTYKAGRRSLLSERNKLYRRLKRARREEQLGPALRCEVCGASGGKALHWDHNHDTGKARGWLCSSCNTALGLLGDNPRLFDRAASYLRERGYALSKPALS